MENLRILEVLNVEEGTPAGDSTKTPGRKSLKLTVCAIDKQITVNGRTVNVKSNKPVQSFQIWGEYTSPDGSQKFKGDALYHKGIVKGDLIEGSIEQRRVAPYVIGTGENAKKVEFATLVCLTDDIDREFDRADHKRPDGTSFLTAASESTVEVPQVHELDSAFKK